MKTLSDCDARYQIADVPFEKKGCSVPAAWVLTGLYGIKDKDEPVPGVSFLPACYEHDDCYRTCKPEGMSDDNYKLKKCDDTFEKNLKNICVKNNLDDEALRWCKDLAELYYDGVSKAGRGVYRGAQIKNCSCCP